jgi:hypothetical protein
MAIRILVLLLFASALYADVKVEWDRISVDLKSVPLSQVLENLKKQTHIKLIVDDGVAGKPISANFQNLPVAMGLKKILEGTGINYAVLAGADGEPQSIFIGGSTALGAPPKRLDSRPVGNRGVVTPVPPPPPPPVPQPADSRSPDQPQIKPLTPGTINVPTGGGFVPNQPKTGQPAETEQPPPQEQLDDDNNEQ